MPFLDFGIFEGTSSDINTYLMNQMVITCTSSTRPSTPVNGMRIWETDTIREMVYVTSTWRLLDEVPGFIIKTPDENVTNSGTLQDDDALVLGVLANTDYIITLVLCVASSDPNTPDVTDMKIGWTVPSGATFIWSPQAPHASYSYSVGIGTDTMPISVNNFISSGQADIATTQFFAKGYKIKGLLRVGGTPGNIQFRWAQTTPHVGVTTTVKGISNAQSSYIRAERVV